METAARDAVQEGAGMGRERIEMVDHRVRRQPVNRGGRIAEADQDNGNAGGLRRAQSTSLSPIIMACEGSPPASTIVPVRWPGSGFDIGKMSRPPMALK